MRKSTLIIFLFLIACCSTNEKEKIVNVSAKHIHIDCLDCYFYLFDKYKQDYTSSEVKQWKEMVINERINGNDFEEHSVFNQKGGGPMGAHWNSDAPLFCMSKLSGISSVEINGSQINTKFGQKNSLNYFSIKDTAWINALRSITTEDYPKIYREHHPLAALQFPEEYSQIESQIGVGEILEITIKDSTGTVCSKAFHIAFGE